MLDALQAEVALGLWTVLVLVHALWRSLHRPAADPIRPSGPVQ